MNRDRILADQTVVVTDGRITEIGPSQAVKIPASACRIDAKGRYLIPGLTDAHVHLYSSIEFPLYLANGVTTVFNLDGRPAHLLWRKQVASGEALGPTIFTAGPLFGRSHTAAEAVRLVDEQADAGYDAVKIYNQVSKEEYPALIAEAKRRNLLLMGHVARGPDFEMTIGSGQSIAHLEEFLYTYFNPQHDDNNDHIVFDEAKIPVVARATAEARIYVIPTLSTYATIVQQATDLDSFLKDPSLKYLPPWALEQYRPEANRYKNGFQPEQYPRLRTSLAFQRKLVKALFDAGVPLMTGTDAPDVGPMAGFGIHAELDELVSDGLSPFQVLQMATVNPARFFRQSAEFGTVEVGKRADLVLLRGNPLADTRATRGIVGVMVRGRWLSSAELAKKIGAIPGAYERELHQTEQDLAADPEKAEQYLNHHDPMGSLGGAAVSDIARTSGISKFRQFVLNVRQADAQSKLVSESGINTLGYNFLREKRYSEALALLRMNTEDFPRSANTYDSLGEALFKSGDVEQARQSYAKALEVDPKYPNADFARKFLAEHVERQ
ncbi:MAG TPA: amidohydrolase family protein [Terriglobales bacterium]|jgi:tetratricopeptide (TPR) repeat protein|nr:amidohydrolase family protein [Terriglobales bacterium]